MSGVNYDFEVELNWEKDCRLKNYQCDRCDKHADFECEVSVVKHGDSGKVYGVYCKAHRETLMEDTVEEMQDNISGQDFDDLED